MYPLSLIKPAGVNPSGFAVANDAAEHEKLSDAGYEPKFVAEEVEHTEARKPGRPPKAKTE